MQVPELQIRLECPSCSTQTLQDARSLSDGSFACSVCQEISVVDVELLRSCAAGLYAIIAKLSERSQS